MLANVQILSGLVISALLILALLIFMKKQTRQTNLKKSFVFTLFFFVVGSAMRTARFPFFLSFTFFVFHLFSFHLFCARQLDSHIHKNKNSPASG